MKKTFMFIAAALVVMAACNKVDTPTSKSLSLKATAEQHEDETKTSLDGTSVVWAVGDAIKVYADESHTAVLTATTAGTTSNFSGDDLAGSPDFAIYPAGAAKGCVGTDITFTLPATQTYVLNSFDPACNVMVGEVDGGTVTFKNVFGLLKLSLKGVMTVSRITLTGKNNEKLNGDFTVDAKAANPAANTVTTETAPEKTITLDCSAYGGVPISRMNATDFYFVVPVGALSSGFTAVIQDAYGVDWKVTLSTINSNTIARKTIRKMPERKVSLLNSTQAATYTEVEYIASDSGAYIETGFNPTVADHIVGWEAGWRRTKTLASGLYGYVFGNYSGADGFSGCSRNIYPEVLATGGAVSICSKDGSLQYGIRPDVGTWVKESCWFDLGYQQDGIWYDRTAEHNVCEPGDYPFGAMVDDNNNTIRIFRPGSGSNPTLRDMGCQLEYLKFLNSTTEARNYFLACKKGAEIGLYDLKNDAWKTETQLAGFESSHLTAGSDWTPDVRR